MPPPPTALAPAVATAAAVAAISSPLAASFGVPCADIGRLWDADSGRLWARGVVVPDDDIGGTGTPSESGGPRTRGHMARVPCPPPCTAEVGRLACEPPALAPAAPTAEVGRVDGWLLPPLTLVGVGVVDRLAAGEDVAVAVAAAAAAFAIEVASARKPFADGGRLHPRTGVVDVSGEIDGGGGGGPPFVGEMVLFGDGVDDWPPSVRGCGSGEWTRAGELLNDEARVPPALAGRRYRWWVIVEGGGGAWCSDSGVVAPPTRVGPPPSNDWKCTSNSLPRRLSKAD